MTPLAARNAAICWPVASLTIRARVRLRKARLATIGSVGGCVSPNEPGGSAASGLTSAVSMRRAMLTPAGGWSAAGLNAYMRRQSAIQFDGRREPLPRNPLVPENEKRKSSVPAWPGNSWFQS